MVTASGSASGTLVPVAREKPGDGRALAPMQWWQSLYRTVMGTDHGGVRWDVDMDFFEWRDTFVLYRDGRQDRVQHGTAAFRLPDGARIEAAMSTYGQIGRAAGRGRGWVAGGERAAREEDAESNAADP